MKVCTDSCLFGAIAAHTIEAGKIAPKSVLDIGGGTGLLSLMLAQKSTAGIDAVEIEKNAAQQMHSNFAESPWHQRLRVFHEDITRFQHEGLYDLIISNPPFYQNQLKSRTFQKNLAKHDGGLTINQLFDNIERRLAPKGNFMVMLPYFMKDQLQNIIATKDWHIASIISVRHSASHPFFRVIVCGNKEKTEGGIQEDSINIYSDNGYSDEFTRLLQDYYL